MIVGEILLDSVGPRSSGHELVSGHSFLELFSAYEDVNAWVQDEPFGLNPFVEVRFVSGLCL